MRFHLEHAHRAIQDSIARVLRDHCTSERRRAAMDAGASDPDLWRALMDVGLGALWAPQAYGGAGLGVVEMALAMESLGAAGAPGPFLPQAIAVRALAASNDSALQQHWVPILATGARKATFCDCQPWAPQDRAPVLVDNRIDGTSRLAPGAVEADALVVRIAGGAFALVDAAQPGVHVAAVNGTDRTRPLASVTFENASARIVTDAAESARVLDAALVLVAADALGGAQRCLDMAVSYGKAREQFGVVIGRFQALKHQLAQMALEVESARALVWYAAYAIDAGLPDASRVAALAKAHLADRFTSVARAAIEAHGGIGYTWDYDLHIWFRRALFDRAYLGAPSLHRERAAALASW